MEQKKTNGKPLSNIEISAFCEQMGLILKSGISSMEGISIMLEEAQEGEEKDLLTTIYEGINETFSLYEALKATNVYPDYMLHMIQIGEETGTLDEVMIALGEHYEREESISRSIRSAVTYPMIMAGMMLLVIVVLLVKVMPIFQQVYVQLGTDMTGISRVLMTIGNGIGRYAGILIVIAIIVAAFAIYCTRSSKGKALIRKIGWRFGFARRLYEAIASCRFADGMALTLRSGLSPDRSMELVSALNEDDHFAEKLAACKQMTDEGTDLSEALFKTGIFTGVYARMASIGSKTGAMESVMAKIASLYEDDIDTRINNTLAALEPTLVIVLSLIVGVILMSVMLPLMGIMSTI